MKGGKPAEVYYLLPAHFYKMYSEQKLVTVLQN